MHTAKPTDTNKKKSKEKKKKNQSKIFNFILFLRNFNAAALTFDVVHLIGLIRQRFFFAVVVCLASFAIALLLCLHNFSFFLCVSHLLWLFARLKYKPVTINLSRGLLHCIQICNFLYWKKQRWHSNAYYVIKRDRATSYFLISSILLLLLFFQSKQIKSH